MKFLCDQMLVRLGRWLRAAGYDTLIIEKSMPDKEVILIANQEKRVLITRDKRLQQLCSDEDQVIWLESNKVGDCAQELSAKIEIDWLKNPFSRCLLCNSTLDSLPQEEMSNIPEGAIKSGTEFKKCVHCQKTFWLGSHTDRMLETLKKWQTKRSNHGQ